MIQKIFEMTKFNKTKLGLLLVSFILVSAPVFGQRFAGGFKAGLNFSTLKGPSETDSSGSEVEENKTNTGFHIGAAFRMELTEVFGLRAELLYSQKGTTYNYDGNSWWVFYPSAGNPIYSTGIRQEAISVTNTYIDIPLMAYARIGRIEVSGGVNASVLLGSRGTGDLTYRGQSLSGANIESFDIALDYNYFSDKYGEANTLEEHKRTIGGNTVGIPKNIGAYYFGVDNGEKLYQRLDFGLNAGLSFYLSHTLFLGFRLNYGLTDITNGEQDIARAQLATDRSFILRTQDHERNFSLQASIGFNL